VRSPGGPSWWRASLPTRSLLGVLRGWTPTAAVAGAGLVLGGCGEVLSQTPDEASAAALEDQRNLGWDVGGEGRPLAFPGAQAADVSGAAGWREAMPTLALRLSPGNARWAPYYSPALFQSLETPRSAELRFVMRPIFTPEMALAHRRGEALLSLLVEQGLCRTDVALVLDLPGPESIAVAAALGPCFDPVFVFDNWPHPLGVVPAHLTLGAAIYFLPAFERDRRARVGAAFAAPPVFVLDRLRLAPYEEDAEQFDNRYFAALPSPEALRAAGIRHLLYVTPDDQVTLEADDVNDDLVEIDGGGVDVKMLALSDFSEAPLPGWPQDPGCAPGGVATASSSPLYFGGSPSAQACFSFWYGLRFPSPGFVLPQPPLRLVGRSSFRPRPRPTFAGGAAHAHGWRTGVFGFSRSGSLGRVHSGPSG
jgi:hypothetical protein